MHVPHTTSVITTLSCPLQDETCYIYYLYPNKHLLFYISEPVPNTYDKCNPSPCGANADCNDGQCTCKPNYFGNPYLSCRPECTTNSDCALNLACSNNKCINPCTNLCGQGALCEVYNHIPMCSCPSNTTGNAFFSCSAITGKYHFTLKLLSFLLIRIRFQLTYICILIVQKLKSIFSTTTKEEPM